jgi:hypothetical protein
MQPQFSTITAAEPHISKQAIGPTEAAELLKRNCSNRKIDQGTVNAYAAEMAGDRWRMTSEPLHFNAAGELIDGQHRLSAVIKANVVVWFAVVRNSDGVLDSGKIRSIADLIKIGSKTAVPVVTAMICYNRPDGKNYSPPIRALATSIEFHFRKYEESINFALGLSMFSRPKKPLSSTVLAVIARAHHYKCDPDMLRAFVSLLETMKPLEGGEQEQCVLDLGVSIIKCNERGRKFGRWVNERTEYILQKYLRNERASKICGAKISPWPIKVYY